VLYIGNRLPFGHILELRIWIPFEGNSEKSNHGLLIIVYMPVVLVSDI
jgi:hypothetical protein